eukprot:CAMPEP_0181506724 /NCGR_PEP_ID=MMETSP1110-20121109/58750_1 /TAXON_ID=174948 /ORGANISM="Symbiodinium sp., Strain CCMP421" /LENGTH=34 /DNA_ID= /DNA_START= /DNA_END= /DNA_ORIENTATION=
MHHHLVPLEDFLALVVAVRGSEGQEDVEDEAKVD